MKLHIVFLFLIFPFCLISFSLSAQNSSPKPQGSALPAKKTQNTAPKAQALPTTRPPASVQPGPNKLAPPPGGNQNGAPITNVAAQVMNQINVAGSSVMHLIGGAHFSQGNANMTSDSAYIYSNENRLVAYGHVVIHQADTVTITGDHLNYSGNTRLAEMQNNCVMTDRQGVLKTDHLNYDLGTKIGTYFDGGRITNQDNILVSRTGYYYENTKICYFKSDVTILTPQTTIKSDTMQYNTVSRIAYFFGPTRITSKDDFIYCENGQYNTATDQASFSKHAYYLSGSNKLIGDSLYYDKRVGFGRSVGHVTYTDTVQNIIMKGGLGQYNKATETSYMTQKPLVILLTEHEDTLNDSVHRADSLRRVDSLGKLKTQKPRRERNPTYAEILAGKTEEIPPGEPGANPPHPPIPDFSASKKKIPVKAPPRGIAQVDSLFLTADTLKSVLVTGDQARPQLAPKISMRVRNRPTGKDSLSKRADRLMQKIKNSVVDDSLRKKGILIPGSRPNEGILKNAGISDTLKKGGKRSDSLMKQVMLKKNTDSLKKKKPGFFARLFGGKRNTAPNDTTARPKAVISAKAMDSLKRTLSNLKGDYKIPWLLEWAPEHLLSVRIHPFSFADTIHYRVIFAYHHARMFKADFQAATDSLVYTYVDSTIRMFVKPALWTSGTQMTSDSISIKLKNRKLDSLIMTRSAFIINQVDTLGNKQKFNQIAGRDMFGKFKNNKLFRMRVEGNGKSLYYASEDKKDSVSHNKKDTVNHNKGKVNHNKDTVSHSKDVVNHKKDTVSPKKTTTVTGLNSEISSFFLMRFKDNRPYLITAVDEPQGHFYPISKVKPGLERLRGFFLRESERPKSKEDLFRLPDKREIEQDSAMNAKPSKLDSTADDYSEDITYVKPKKKKVVKGKPAKKSGKDASGAVILPGTAGAPPQDSSKRPPFNPPALDADTFRKTKVDTSLLRNKTMSN